MTGHDTIVFLDGAFLPEEEAKIPVGDRGLLMGDGIFTTVQVREGLPLFLKRHLQKLVEQSQRIGIKCIPPTIEQVMELIEKNRAFEGVWRLKIYCTGGSGVEMRLPEGRCGHSLMILKPYAVPPFQPLRLAIYPHPVYTQQAALKSLSHLGRYMVMENALQRGFDDGITTTEKATVLETAFGNLFWVVDQVFYAPHPILPLHFGITIAVASQIAQQLGMVTKFVRIPLAEIPDTAYLFRTNSMGGIRPVAAIENRVLVRNEKLEELFLSAYIKYAEEESSLTRLRHFLDSRHASTSACTST